MGSHYTAETLKRQNEKLRRENQKLEEENKQLKEEIRELKKKLNEERKEKEKIQREFEEYKARYPAIDFIPDFVKKPVKRRRKKKNGQKKGHKGYSRKIPERIDMVKPLTIERCPYCGNELSDVQEIRKRYVEDIPEISNTIVIEYRIERRYCKHCRRMVEPLVPDVLPNARFGLRLMLLIVFLKVGFGFTSRKNYFFA